MPTTFHLSRAVLAVPVMFSGDSTTETGLPERWESVPRLNACQLRRVLSSAVLLEPADPDIVKGFEGRGAAVELGQVLALVEADDMEEARARSGPVIEAVVDTMSFQMQVPVHIVSFDIHTTESDPDGNVNITSYSAPETFLSARFSSNQFNFQWEFPAAVRPDLSLASQVPSDRARKALHWYIKALDAPYLADQFIALWIALETLEPARREHHEPPPKPYHAPCGHLIDECPQCGSSIKRSTSGDRLKQCLQLDGQMTHKQAQEAWQVRQLMHGQGGFSPEQVQTLGRVTPSLRAAILSVLRLEMGLGPEEPPFARSTGGPILGSTVMLRGTSKLEPNMATRIRLLKELSAATAEEGPVGSPEG